MSRSAEIMAIVRELSDGNVTRQEIARRASTSHGHVSQASRLLRDAPDLADQVERGELGLTNAYRMLYARTVPGSMPQRSTVSG